MTAACSARSVCSSRSSAEGSSSAANVFGSLRRMASSTASPGLRSSARRLSRVVAVGAGVPGVGGELPAALGDITGHAVKGGRGEEVDLTPGAALCAVDGAGPCVRDVRVAVDPTAGDDFGVDLDLLHRRRSPHRRPCACHAEHGGGRAVAHAPVRSRRRGWRARGSGRLGRRSAGWDPILVLGGSGRAVRRARHGWRGCGRRGLRSPRGSRPARRRVRRRDGRRPRPRPRPTRRGYRSWLARSCSQPWLGADGLAGVDVTRPVFGERGAFGGVALTAVLAQPRRRDHTVGGESLDLGGESARRDRLGLADVSDEPHLACPASRRPRRLTRRRRGWRPGTPRRRSPSCPPRVGRRQRDGRIVRSSARRARPRAARRPPCASVPPPRPRRPVDAAAAAAAWSAVVLPNPAGATSTRTDGPAPHSTRTASI